MKHTLPMIKKHYDEKLKMNYYLPSEIDEDDIEDTIKTRGRFAKVDDLLKKIMNINDEDFSNNFTNHYLIRAKNINDARIAMIALYNTIYLKLMDNCCPGDYIKEASTDCFLMHSGGGPVGEGDDIFGDETEDEMTSDTNPIVYEIEPWEVPSINMESDADKIVFALYNKEDSGYCSECARDRGQIYVEVTEDSAEDVSEFLQNMLDDAGYDCSGIDKELRTMVRNLENSDEYTINRIFRMMTSSHLLNHPNDKTLRLEDIEPFLSNIKKTRKPVKKLNGNLVGLNEELKKLKGIVDMLRFEKRRQKFGYQTVNNGCNIAFAGPPGTAKTTLARQFAKSLEEAGLIKSAENFKECKKSDIIGAYVGWTAKQVDTMFREIASKGGGVIFFDEIYTLSDSKTDYDKEAITCITQNMEDYRDKVFCIFAGYGDKMNEFLSANPGLRSRIQFNIKFNEYDNDTLYDIFCSIVKNNDFETEGDFKEAVIDYFKKLKAMRGEQFGNGREARNLFANAVQKMSYRLGEENDLTRHSLVTLTADDICLAAEDILNSELNGAETEQTRIIGFAV